MLFGKHRVGVSLRGSGIYAVSYWGGILAEASVLCGIVLGIMWWLPEETGLEALTQVPHPKKMSVNHPEQVHYSSCRGKT